MDRSKPDSVLPPELAPVLAAERRREAERDRALARLRRLLAGREGELRRLAQALEDSELRRVAELGALRYDMEQEREKNAELREKLARAESARRAAARDVLGAKLFGATQDSDRKALERELADARAELERLRAEVARLAADGG